MSLERPDYLNESSPADPDLNIREEPSVANVDEPPRYEVAFFSPEFMEVIEENRRMEHELLEHWQSDAESGGVIALPPVMDAPEPPDDA